jgi:hypothetical protein
VATDCDCENFYEAEPECAMCHSAVSVDSDSEWAKGEVCNRCVYDQRDELRARVSALSADNARLDGRVEELERIFALCVVPLETLRITDERKTYPIICEELRAAILAATDATREFAALSPTTGAPTPELISEAEHKRGTDEAYRLGYLRGTGAPTPREEPEHD